MAFLAPIGGAIAGGLLQNKGAKQSAQSAADAQQKIAQQQFQNAVNYQNQLRAGLQSTITGMGPNPFISALSQMRAPTNTSSMPTQTYGAGGSGTTPPMYGTNGAQPSGGGGGVPASNPNAGALGTGLSLAQGLLGSGGGGGLVNSLRSILQGGGSASPTASSGGTRPIIPVMQSPIMRSPISAGGGSAAWNGIRPIMAQQGV